MAKVVIVLIFLHDFRPLLYFAHSLTLHDLLQVEGEDLMSEDEIDSHDYNLWYPIADLEVRIVFEILDAQAGQEFSGSAIFIIVRFSSEILQPRVDSDRLYEVLLLLLGKQKAFQALFELECAIRCDCRCALPWVLKVGRDLCKFEKRSLHDDVLVLAFALLSVYLLLDFKLEWAADFFEELVPSLARLSILIFTAIHLTLHERLRVLIDKRVQSACAVKVPVLFQNSLVLDGLT